MNTPESPPAKNTEAMVADLLSDATIAAAKLSVDASIAAEEVIAKASNVAAKLHESKEHHDEHTKQIIVEALNTVFGEKEEQQQFLNLNRVPFICAQINEIHTKLGEIVLILESLKIVKQIVFGMVAIIIIGFLGVLASVVYK